jgi:hypothetical protein
MMKIRTVRQKITATHLSRSALAFAGIGLVAIMAGGPAHADLRDDVTQCSAITEDASRLACFDAAATTAESERNAAAQSAAALLADEFRFDRSVMRAPLHLRVDVSGNFRLARDTTAGREVETIVRRITKAIGEVPGWNLSITVHGGQVTLSRGSPYTGDELLIQARAGMSRSDLPEARYTITQGADAEPSLWDDGRVRSANEHIDIVITDLGGTAAR